jgi:hypothetical protein
VGRDCATVAVDTRADLAQRDQDRQRLRPRTRWGSSSWGMPTPVSRTVIGVLGPATRASSTVLAAIGRAAAVQIRQP